MNTVYIDTKQLNTVQLLQDYLKETLNLPSYYGGNLDALYDALTTIHADTEIYRLRPYRGPQQFLPQP